MSHGPGKTYTLFSAGQDNRIYFELVKTLVDDILVVIPDPEEALVRLQVEAPLSLSGRLFRAFRRAPGLPRLAKEVISKSLSPFTVATARHLQTLKLSDRFDRILSTPAWICQLFMVEIELANRVFKHAFATADDRIAFLPHCLRDFRPGCRSRFEEIEHVCRHCCVECTISKGSRILRSHGIDPYIAMDMNLHNLIRKLKLGRPGLGVLGVACVPELVAGLRLCQRLGIPAQGVPLNANRCSRWLGEAQENSFDLIQLELLMREE